jgi:prevent-host-death family protein
MITIMKQKSATNEQLADSDSGPSVGIRDLRDNLSRHLEKVKDGGEITVTDHGRPVARIVPFSGPSRFEQMIADGRITPAVEPKGDPPEPIANPGKPLSEIVIEMRR